MGAAGVVMCTASNAAYGQALSFLKFGGTLVCVGVPEGDPVRETQTLYRATRSRIEVEDIAILRC